MSAQPRPAIVLLYLQIWSCCSLCLGLSAPFILRGTARVIHVIIGPEGNAPNSHLPAETEQRHKRKGRVKKQQREVREVMYEEQTERMNDDEV